MIYELNHFGIVVRDLAKSLDFYENVLGAKMIFKNVIESTQTDVIYLQVGGGIIELLYRSDPPEGEDFGVTHIAFMTDDLDSDYQKLIYAGYQSVVAPRTAGSGVGRLAFIRDPNGARLELIERDVKMRVEPIDHPVVRSFDHYSLIANDQEAAIKFYREHLGMSILKTMTVPATELTITYLNYDYDVLELLHRPSPSSDPVFAHIALRVDNVNDALATFAAQGIPADPDSPRPAGTGLGHVGIIRDPDGVKIELLDRPDLRSL